ncbi:MAG: sigma 54-interacting transcriptional regulator [Blastocatellia bacterium]|nr:sigma 54-interacting transcriptional regulator [Blastocatellia bacterium]
MTNTQTEPYTILDLQNGRLPAPTAIGPDGRPLLTEITRLAWIHDQNIAKPLKLLADMSAETVPPLPADYYAVFLLCSVRNEWDGEKALRLFQLRNADKSTWPYPDQEQWIDIMQAHLASWHKNPDKSSYDKLKAKQDDPLSQAYYMKFRAVDLIKARDRKQKQTDVNHLEEFEKIDDYLSQALSLFEGCSQFEAGRMYKESAERIPDLQVERKIELFQKAERCFINSKMGHLAWRTHEGLSKAMDMQRTLRAVVLDNSKNIGELIRNLKKATSIQEFARETVNFLNSSSFLAVRHVRFFRRDSDREHTLAQIPETLPPDFNPFTVELRYGYALEFTAGTDPDALDMVTSQIKQLMDDFMVLEPNAPQSLPIPLGKLRYNDIGYLRAVDQAEAVIRLPRDKNILITGPSGSGKTILIREIHILSNATRFGNLVEFNCAGFGDNSVRSWCNLSGAAKNAFQEFKQDYPGLFGQAQNGGTVFLDEIGEMPLQDQAKFLKWVEDRKYYWEGRPEVLINMNFRIAFATNRDPDAMSGFRKDLLHRISAHRIHLPSLNEVPGQIIHLAELQLKKLLKEFDLSPKAFKLSPDVEDYLRKFDWNCDQGNSRKLMNLVETVVARARVVQEKNPEFTVLTPQAFEKYSTEKDRPDLLPQYKKTAFYQETELPSVDEPSVPGEPLVASEPSPEQPGGKTPTVLRLTPAARKEEFNPLFEAAPVPYPDLPAKPALQQTFRDLFNRFDVPLQPFFGNTLASTISRMRHPNETTVGEATFNQIVNLLLDHDFTMGQEHYDLVVAMGRAFKRVYPRWKLSPEK